MKLKKQKNKIQKNIIKYIIGLCTVILLRLLPHPPNVEPIMSTMMPFAKRWGLLAGFFFSITAILCFDLLTGTLGVWSLMTAGTYGLLGIIAGLYFRNRESRIRNYVAFSLVGTIVYDAITGIGTGMLFFNQSFTVTFLGQIPFTLYHLAGNLVFAVVVSPLIYSWVLDNKQLETNHFINSLKSGFSVRS